MGKENSASLKKKINDLQKRINKMEEKNESEKKIQELRLTKAEYQDQLFEIAMQRKLYLKPSVCL